jgi:hypothetical protein
MLEGSGQSPPYSDRFTPGKETRYPLYRMLGGPQGRSGRVRKLSPPTGIRFSDRAARSEPLYRLRYPDPRPLHTSLNKVQMNKLIKFMRLIRLFYFYFKISDDCWIWTRVILNTGRPKVTSHLNSTNFRTVWNLPKTMGIFQHNIGVICECGFRKKWWHLVEDSTL